MIQNTRNNKIKAIAKLLRWILKSYKHKMNNLLNLNVPIVYKNKYTLKVKQTSSQILLTTSNKSRLLRKNFCYECMFILMN